MDLNWVPGPSLRDKLVFKNTSGDGVEVSVGGSEGSVPAGVSFIVVDGTIVSVGFNVSVGVSVGISVRFAGGASAVIVEKILAAMAVAFASSSLVWKTPQAKPGRQKSINK